MIIRAQKESNPAFDPTLLLPVEPVRLFDDYYFVGNKVVGFHYGVSGAVERAFQFASSCVKTWEYAKETGCDVFLNPHPHLRDLLQQAQQNQNRQPGQPNAFVIGQEGVRQRIVERFDACVEAGLKYTDIQEKVKESE